ncbi:phosphotransferase [Paenibacillus dokdonensis]|uniref:Phosphotransferase n=1 Tax=Paenibacillus dokdonensis TaxID=2567944 RepID=A0ABU6GGU6_9BACL|nr:phosphotransferase [Paenibacillus dokdonensis]MEC0238938.1 phosphotransferase [Paenibacillus dokdonensis]
MSKENQISSLYAPITDEQILSIARDTFGEGCKVKQISLLKGGQFNTTYVFETEAAEGKWVLRLAPVEHAHLYSFEKEMMAIEPYIYGLLQAEDIPSSRVIRYDETGNLIARPYLLIEFIKSWIIQLYNRLPTTRRYNIGR